MALFMVQHNFSKTEKNLFAGPPAKEELFYRLRDENNKRIHHSLRGRERQNYQNTQENWENALVKTMYCHFACISVSEIFHYTSVLLCPPSEGWTYIIFASAVRRPPSGVRPRWFPFI